MPERGSTVFGWYAILSGRVYPLTVVGARYQGVYEGGRYLAFPCEPEAIPPGWNGGDSECNDWFSDREEAPIGRGNTLDAAHADLLQRLAAAPTTETEQ